MLRLRGMQRHLAIVLLLVVFFDMTASSVLLLATRQGLVRERGSARPAITSCDCTRGYDSRHMAWLVQEALYTTLSAVPSLA